jgi:membrane protein implicated in regulation of membrane protease activity
MDGAALAAGLGFGTAVVVLLTAISTLILSFLNRKRVQEIHVMVNAQSLDLNRRIDQLTGALAEAGVSIPDRADLEER